MDKTGKDNIVGTICLIITILFFVAPPIYVFIKYTQEGFPDVFTREHEIEWAKAMVKELESREAQFQAEAQKLGEPPFLLVSFYLMVAIAVISCVAALLFGYASKWSSHENQIS